MSLGHTEEEAIRANYELRPAGPAARPEVVWVVRTYWLECVNINRQLPPNRRVPPETLLIEWLQNGGRSTLVAVLSGMPYWPIGIDQNGEFC